MVRQRENHISLCLTFLFAPPSKYTYLAFWQKSVPVLGYYHTKYVDTYPFKSQCDFNHSHSILISIFLVSSPSNFPVNNRLNKRKSAYKYIYTITKTIHRNTHTHTQTMDTDSQSHILCWRSPLDYPFMEKGIRKTSCLPIFSFYQ